jgi:hypothetical protein
MPKLFRASNLLAILAAIMLVIGGAPAWAAASPCNPCPPDCPMMAPMKVAKTSADHHAPAPGKSGKADDPCKSGLACQAAFATPLLPEAAAETLLTAQAADHRLTSSVGGPSRPPDPGLRPPIQL